MKEKVFIIKYRSNEYPYECILYITKNKIKAIMCVLNKIYLDIRGNYDDIYDIILFFNELKEGIEDRNWINYEDYIHGIGYYIEEYEVE